VKRVLFVFPTAWDARQLAGCRAAWCDRYEVVLDDPNDDDCAWDYDVLAYIGRAVEERRGKIDGVASSSDYPGATVAGAIATRLGLPGTPPEKLMRASHKYYSRLLQREAAPEATPGFTLVDPRRPDGGVPDLGFPCFIKPVKGAFSVMSGRLDGRVELEAFLARPETREFVRWYVLIFNQLVRALTDFEFDGSWFIAEELIRGGLVTVDGFVSRGRVEILGIVDSELDARTGSFTRFVYPSSLPEDVQERVRDIARRVVGRLGLAEFAFNVEMMFDASTDRIQIVEVNPRIAGQFADLYEKVDGTNAYEAVLDLATGAVPSPKRRTGTCAVAASVPMRVFEPVRVARAPEDADVRAAESLFPGTRVWAKSRAGDDLSHFGWPEDGHSFRYAVMNLGAADPAELARRIDAVRDRLGYRFERI